MTKKSTPQTTPAPKGTPAVLRSGWGRVVFAVFSFGFLGLLLAIILFLGVLWKYGSDLPDYKQLADYEPPTTTRIHAGDGRLIAEYAVQKRVFVPISSIPKPVIHAFVSTEDQNFYDHPGVDIIALTRAVVQNIPRVLSGKRLIGASTITQQVAKNFLLTNDYSFDRKIKEAILALRIERALSKDRIMELYLNEIYLGYGSYGVAMASLNYFDKPLDQLTIAQSAYLATLAKAPSNYHPIRKRDSAIARRNWVVSRMMVEGYISREDMVNAQNEDFTVKKRTGRDEAEAAYFVEEVRRELVNKFGSDGFYKGGLSVRTTLDSNLQDIADKSLRWGLLAYDRRHGYRGVLTRIADIAQQVADKNATRADDKKIKLPPLGDTGATGVQALSVADKINYLSHVKKPKGGHMWNVALVDSVADTYATVTLADGRRGVLPLHTLAWARKPLKDGYRVGATIKTLKTVLSVGDVVLVDPVTPARTKKARTTNAKRLQANFKTAGDVLYATITHNTQWEQRQQDMKTQQITPNKGDVKITVVGENPPTPKTAQQDIAEQPAPTAPMPPVAEMLKQALVLDLRQVPLVNGGLIAMDPHTGRVLAMSGGWSYNHSEFNRVVQAYRQPGSAVKPFVYLTALENGYTPATLILDAPFVLDIPGQGKWKPANYSNKFYGPSLMRVGIERSRNAMTVRLAQDVGMDKIVDTLEKFDIADNVKPLLSYSLGSGETTLLRLGSAYAMLVNGGRRVTPTLLDRVQDRNGRNVYRHDERPCHGCNAETYTGVPAPMVPNTAERLVDDASAFQVVKMLEGVVQRGTGRRIRELGIPLAGKTGTTNDLKDTWFMGFSPDLVVGVYVGFDLPRILGRTPVGIWETGSTVTAPIFKEFMGQALGGKPKIPFRTPPSVKFVRIDSTTGQLPTKNTNPKDIMLEVFKPNTEPTRGAGGRLVSGGTPETQDKSNPKPKPKNIGKSSPGLY